MNTITNTQKYPVLNLDTLNITPCPDNERPDSKLYTPIDWTDEVLNGDKKYIGKSYRSIINNV